MFGALECAPETTQKPVQLGCYVEITLLGTFQLIIISVPLGTYPREDNIGIG